MSGLPPSSRNCFGNGRPMRLPTPPASTIIPIFMRTSGALGPAPLSPSRLGSSVRQSVRETAGPVAPGLSSATGTWRPRVTPDRARSVWQAVPEDPAIEVAAIRWERVQLIVEARDRPVSRRSIWRRFTPRPRRAAARRWRRHARRSTATASRSGSTCWSVRASSRWRRPLDARRARRRRAVAGRGAGPAGPAPSPSSAARNGDARLDRSGRTRRLTLDVALRRDRPRTTRRRAGRSGSGAGAVRLPRSGLVSRLVRRRGRQRVLFASRF